MVDETEESKHIPFKVLPYIGAESESDDLGILAKKPVIEIDKNGYIIKYEYKPGVIPNATAGPGNISIREVFHG